MQRLHVRIYYIDVGRGETTTRHPLYITLVKIHHRLAEFAATAAAGVVLRLGHDAW